MKLHHRHIFTLSVITSSMFFSGNVLADLNAISQPGIALTSQPTTTATASSQEAIAIGTNAAASGKNTGLRAMLLGNLPNAQGGISIGENAVSQENGIHIGHRTQKAAYGSRAGATIVGTDSDSGGLMSSVFGTGSKVKIDQNVKAFGLSNVQGTLASSVGAYNIIDATKQTYDGMATAIVGAANTIEGSNGSTIFGVGNKISNSYVDPALSASQALSMLGGDLSVIGDTELASVGVMGGGNTVDYGRLSTVNGVKNTLKGKNGDLAERNQITGYKNTVTDSDDTILTGTENTVTNGKQNIVLGDQHNLVGDSQDQNTRNVVIGYSDNTEWKNISKTVALGSDQKIDDDVKEAVLVGDKAEVKVSTAVALGSSSLADRAAVNENAVTTSSGNADATNNEVYALEIADDADKSAVKNTVKGELAAVSVGNSNATRQITNVAAGSADTDVVNVAQLKSVGNAVERNTTNITNISNNLNQVRNQVDNLDRKVNKLDKRLTAGIAGATAIAFLERPNAPGKSMVSVAVGGYRNASAIAVGYAKNSENNKRTVKFGVGINTQKDIHWGGSLGYQW